MSLQNKDWLPKDLTSEEEGAAVGLFLHKLAQENDWVMLTGEENGRKFIGIECNLEEIMQAFLLTVTKFIDNWGKEPEVEHAIECARLAWMMKKMLDLVETGLTQAVEHTRDVQRRVN